MAYAAYSLVTPGFAPTEELLPGMSYRIAWLRMRLRLPKGRRGPISYGWTGPYVRSGVLLLKTFHYGGGSVTFAIPESWTDELEEDEVGVFYSDAPDAGVLRVRSKTFYNPRQTVTGEAVAELLLGMAKRLVPEDDHETETLPDGNLLLTYLQTFPDDSPPIVVASWLVGVPTPPHHVQVVSYTYTVPGQFAATPATIEELELVELAIREAEYEVEV